MKIIQYKISTPFGHETRLGILENYQQTPIVIDPQLVWCEYFFQKGFHRPQYRAEQKIPSKLSSLLKTHENPIESLLTAKDLFFQLINNQSHSDAKKISWFIEYDQNNLQIPLDQISTYRDFYAHEKHVRTGFKKRNEEIPPAWFEIPAYYKGSTVGFIGPNEDILWPSFTKQLDYELELAVVIGKDGKNIKEENAINHIFGYTILNDISARDIQRKEMSIRLGPSKGKDFCSILGPVIVTADEFNFQEPNLLMTATINGQEWSRGMSGDAHYNFSQMIAHVALDEWVLSGDVFGSGTVGTGCGLELDRWIQPGDSIDLFVEGIGHLINKVGQPISKS